MKPGTPRAAPTKLLMTPELERLARWLRLLGCDVNMYRGQPLAIYPAAYGDGRVVVTGNTRIVPSSLVRIIHVKPVQLEQQLKRVVRALKLRAAAPFLFSRCGACNTMLAEIPKARIKTRVPPYVFKTQERFTTCPTCHRIYWTATHHDRAQAFLVKLGVAKRSRAGRTRATAKTIRRSRHALRR